MDAFLTPRAFTHRSTSPACSILVYAESPYDVEIARHEHLANYAFDDATDHVPPRLASVYARVSASR